MWPFGKLTARRQEIRRSKAERGLTWYSRLPGQMLVRPVVTMLFCSVVATAILNAGAPVFDLRVGQTVPRALTAREPFRLPDQQRFLALRDRARDSSPNFYTLDTSLIQEIRGRLLNLLPIARERAGEREVLRAEAAKNRIVLDDAGLEELERLASVKDQGDTAKSPNEFEIAVERALQTLARQPLVETHAAVKRRNALQAVLSNPLTRTDETVAVSDLLFSQPPDTEKRAAAAASVSSHVASAFAGAFSKPLQASMSASIVELLRGEAEGVLKPLYRFEPAQTQKTAEDAAAAVPMQYVEYAVDARLADVGVLTAEEILVLRAEHAANVQRMQSGAQFLTPLRLEMFGRAVLAFLVIFGLGGYVMLYRERLTARASQHVVMAAVLLGILALTRFVYVQTSIPNIAVGAQAFVAALVAIVHRRGPVYGVSALMSLLLALATEQTVAFFIVLLAVSMTTLYGLREVRNRGKIVAVGLLAAVVAGLTTIVAGMLDGQTLRFALLHQASWAAITSIAAGFLIEGTLPGIERLFGLSTAMTLLEWCDANKPLLRLMAAEAPGTYNHSLTVGMLAEAACEAVGANGLLARAGAYYHDIGKINKPEYFVENQQLGMGSRHERLSPTMSLLIIIGHVKDGIEMAREYRVPPSLHPFITEHHGTTLVEYFYHAATKARKPDDPEVPESEYRYPGPRPQSVETAVVMICDSVEGAVRAMPEPTPARIEDTVRRIVQKRLMDGQFDECELTFRELETIVRSVTKSLNSIYHGRIAYPSGEEATRTAVNPQPRHAS